MIKNYCVVCWGKFKDMTPERFKLIGNYCGECNARATRVTQHQTTKEEADNELKLLKRVNYKKIKL